MSLVHKDNYSAKKTVKTVLLHIFTGATHELSRGFPESYKGFQPF